jgi:predicted adenine nucleotide alpha hydrolase (AANH) superfamily ATPase
MYRQPYCGCIYSEKQRFYKSRVWTPKQALGFIPFASRDNSTYVPNFTSFVFSESH